MRTQSGHLNPVSCGRAVCILVVLLASLGRGAGQANQFYVAVEEKGASDDNDGARAVHQGGKIGPWRTIRRALRAAQPGDTIFVGRGRYAEEVSLTVPRIRLRALSGARPLIDGENVRSYGIRNPDTAAIQDVLIEGFEIAHHTVAGVMIAGRGSKGVTIRGNIIRHAMDKGITVRGTGHRIEGNTVFMIGNNQEAMGIHLASASDCLVQDNDVLLCKKTAIRDQSGKRNTIQNNLMHQCWTGLDYNGCSGTRAFNNYIYDNSQGFNPKHVKGDAGWNLFWHNTVYDSHGPHISIAVNRADTSAETVQVSKEMEFPAHEVNLGDFQSPLATCNGNIYFVWVDAQMRTCIARKSPDGAVTTNIIFDKTDPDPYHNEASVGVDRDGYIHVVGNMHNSPYGRPDGVNLYYEHPWQYKVSDRPEDISAFTFVGGDPDRTIPGTWITYPFFARDRKGSLYIAFRHRIRFERGWSPGIMAGAVARYDADTRRWQMLGGTDYEHGVKTLIWNPGGASAYQGYKVRLFFDRLNRMHVGWDVFTTKQNRGGSGATHVLYACSEDGGVSFRKADGQAYTQLPITIARGDVVFRSEAGGLYNLTHLGVLPDGQPATSFTSRGARLSRWLPGEGWSTAGEFPASFPARFVTDDRGVITAVESGAFHRSFDGGRTWRRYSVETGSANACIFDYPYLAQTGQLRYQAQSGGTVKVYTAIFSGNQRQH